MPHYLPLQLTTFEQLLVIFNAFVFKPIYMILTLMLIVLLWRKTRRELMLMRYALVSFLIGEMFCMTNYLATDLHNDGLEIGHQLGMLGLMVLLPWALFVFYDTRILRYTHTDTPCVAVGFCGHCWKKEAVACGFHRGWMLWVAVLMILTLMPITTPIRAIYVVFDVFGTKVFYPKSQWVQVVQFRIYPAIAAALLLTALVILLRGKKGLPGFQLPFFVGLGFLSFSLFRFVITNIYRANPVYIDFWEQLTELISIVGIAIFLWIFHRQFELSLGNRDHQRYDSRKSFAK